ncbi:Glyoxalase-like domain-containing protein [Paenibacillus uliginis N3/975]|uniref:Glyoxalase-like domain-containing protein n=2 Tax=Paenibacillus TaxID=44249 RepID=A0A1X7H3U6_9BACL|nr:Glyoxalase-like domain-containing protein [Paenibacillus uliginis N3/975]
MNAIIKKDIIGVMLYVNDLKRAGEWYCNSLGFSMGDFDFNDFVELTIDGQYVMHLFKAESYEPIERAVFTFNTNDISEAHRSLTDKGIETSNFTHYGDHSGFTFKDCDRNTLMICQYK